MNIFRTTRLTREGRFLPLLLKFICATIIAIVLVIGRSTASYAQAVSWQQVDLGYTGSAGTESYSAGSPPVYTIAGAGTGIGYTSDAMTFVYAPVCGNTEMETRVYSQSSVSGTAMSGLMIRDYLGGNWAAMACIAVTPSSGVVFQYRPHEGVTTTVSGPAVSAPVYLRLTLAGDTVSGFSSNDGLDWSLVGSYTASGFMPNLYYEGFTVSGATGSLNTAVFDYETLMTSVPQTSGDLLLWLRSDVGLTYASGLVSGWADQSGNGNNGSSSGAAEPGLVTGAINNAVLPAVSFSGSQYMTLPSGFADLTDGYSIFIVLEPTSSVATGNPCTIGNTSNNDAVFPQTVGTTASLYAYNGATSSSVSTSSGALSNSQYQLLEETFQPGASAGTGVGTVIVNGSQLAQATNMVQNLNNTTRSANYVGAGIGLTNLFQGNISEVLIYSAAMSPEARAMVESYVLSKYAAGNTPTLDAPTFSPQSSIDLPRQTVTMSQDQNATVLYTTDGSTPSANSQWFSNAVPVYVPSSGGVNSNSETINAIAVAPFFNNSSQASSVYQIDPTTSAISRNGLVCWFRADNGATLSSGKVSSWSDVSGSGNTATQATSGDRPTFVSNAVNGLPALSFNGSSDFLQLPSTGLANFSSGCSCFIVTSPASVSAGARFFDFGNGSTSDNLYMDEPTSTGASLYTYNGSSGTSVTSGSAIALNQFQLLEAIDGSGTANIFTNAVFGATNASMNSLNNIARANNYIGQSSSGGNYFNGQIAELLLYNRALSPAEQSLVQGYLIQRYSLLSANSTPAPIISVAAGTLSAPTQVAIWAPAGSTLVYTTDGTTPTTSSPVYSAPINVSFSQTVKAMCVLNGVESSVTSAAYTLDSTHWPAPSGSDPTSLQMQLQLPTVSIPQDSNQH